MKNRYDGLDEVIVSNARACAKRLKSKEVLRFLDIEDIEQELMCEALLCLQTFDESKGNFEHFLRKVLARRSINLLQSYASAKRGSFVNFREYNDEVFGTNDDLASDINFLTNRLPNKYKALCELLKTHTITEASKIIGCNRTALYRDLKRISALANHSINHEILFFIRKGVSMKDMSILETLSAKEISVLEPADLMCLHDQVINLSGQVKTMKEKLDDGMNLRFSEIVRNNLRSESKDTGTTRFFDGAFQIIAEVPKKVTWDTEKMEQIIRQIPEENRKAIIKASYSIDERKYLELPSELQLIFKEARTVTPGKTRFQISAGDQS